MDLAVIFLGTGEKIFQNHWVSTIWINLIMVKQIFIAMKTVPPGRTDLQLWILEIDPVSRFGVLDENEMFAVRGQYGLS